MLKAYRHWKVGELASAYPEGIPEAIRFGIEVFDAALNAVHVVDIRAEREDWKRKNADRDAAHGAPAAPPRAERAKQPRPRGIPRKR